MTSRPRPSLVIVTAFGEEAKIARRAFDSVPAAFAGCDIQTSGLGPRRAQLWAEKFLSRVPNAVVLITGFCGGLVNSVRVGDVVLPATLQEHSGGPSPALSFRQSSEFISGVERRLKSQPFGFNGAAMITVDEIVEESRRRAELFASTGGETVDMESARIVSVCKAKGLGYFVLKVVSDDCGDDLRGLDQLYRSERGLTPATMATWLTDHPQAADRLRQNSGIAKRHLDSALRVALEELNNLFAMKEPT